MGKRYKEYIEGIKELNVVLQQLAKKYNYNIPIDECTINDINNKIEFFDNIRKMCDYIKKDYSIKLNVSLDDITLYHMKDYYLLYSTQNKDNVWCYDLEGNVLWKSSDNVKFISENGEDFIISIANESIGKLESSGYIFRVMTYEDNKIRRVPGATIEDVIEYEDLNDNLLEVKTSNGKVSVFDKKTNQIIICDVDEIDKSNNKFEFFITKKLIDNNEQKIIIHFDIDIFGYIIGDFFDNKSEIYSIDSKDRYNKFMYNEFLENKYKEIRKKYQEKERQLIKK